MVPLFFAYSIFLVALSVCKSAEWFLPTINALEHWLGGDKWMHFKLAVTFSFLACFVSERVMGFALGRRILAVFGFLVAALLLDEAHQYIVASRRFEWLDLAYGVCGLVGGIVIYLVVLVMTSRFGERRNT
ncbi:VanZ family protein [Thalassolituus oleivorans]|uniref:VanZ family protein n=1 Tax=Thalassolituus oleivorans TaxID=187493 RepID=UPI0023F35D24|nr:VanZ family protein [Thalassolituus oleivorans]